CLMAAYARLARLPRPRLEPVLVAEWVRRVAALETRLLVTVCPGPEMTIQADGGQLDQLLINLVRNAVDATLEGGGQVELGWAALPVTPETAPVFSPARPTARGARSGSSPSG